MSAFVQEEADERHRNATFIAVGVLVPLSYGRLGRSWLHAQELRDLARGVIKDQKDKRALELFWQKTRHEEGSPAARQDAASSSPSEVRRMSLPQPTELKRKRARSHASTMSRSHTLTADHPALSVTDLLDTFGPLTFPLYRACLLRKRILVLGIPPVQKTCNFVYMLSILSSIPQALAEALGPDPESKLRTQTLFNVSISDIPFLSGPKRRSRWLACTTDDILGEKKDLYDVLVKLPSTQQHSQGSISRWPKLQTSADIEIKATQRDLRRYRLLRSELKRTDLHLHEHSRTSFGGTSSETTPLARSSTANIMLAEVKPIDASENQVVEPVSWTAMAYDGIMWWLSAGEAEAWAAEETRNDRELMEEVPEPEVLLSQMSGGTDSDERYSAELEHEKAAADATVVAAYFHRLTSQTLRPLTDIVEDADDDTVEGIAQDSIVIGTEDIRTMGLDSWSAADRDFIKEAAKLYFDRDATLDDRDARICGVKIC